MTVRFVPSSSKTPIRDALRRQTVALVVLVLGLAITGTVATYLARGHADAERVAFEGAAAQRVARLDASLHDEVHDLESIALLVSVTPHFDLEFFRSAARFHQQRPGAAGGLVWIPRVPHSQRESFEAAARAEGFDGFRIMDRSAGGERQVAPVREEYFPNLYREPMPPGRPGNGLDIGNDPSRRNALVIARDSARTSVTGRVAAFFITGARSPNAVQAFFPVYHGSGMEVPESVEARRARFRGAVANILPAEDLVDASLPEGLPEGWSLQLAATSGPDERRGLIERGPATAPGALLHEALIGPNELRLAVRFARPAPALGSAPWTAAVGVALSLLLAMLVGSLKARREEEHESEARLAAILEACPDAMVVKDSALRYRMVNRAFCERARLSPEQAIGRTNEELFGDALPPHVREAEEACSRTGLTQSYEFRAERDAASTWYESVVVPLGEGRQRDGSIVITVRDITSRKELEGARDQRARDALRASEDRFRALAMLASDWFWEQDAELRFVRPREDESQAMVDARRLGDAPYGLRRWEIPGFAAAPEALAAHRAALERREPFRNFEYSVTREDGEVHWFNSNGEPVFGPDGAFLGYRGTGREVTERRRAAELERELSEQRRAVLENLLAAVIVIDERGTIETFSRQAEAIFGYAAHEVVGRNVSMLVPEPYRSRHDGYLERYGRTGERRIIGGTRELYGVRKDGREVPIELGITEIVVDGRRKYTGMVRDLTARRAAQAALVASEERFRGLFENSPEPVIVQDGQRILTINPAGVALLGAASENEVIGRYLGDFVVDDGERASGKDRQRQLIEGAPSRLPMREYRFRGLDGRERIVEAVSASFRTPDGPQIVTSYRDVTEQRATRAALQASEDRFRRLFDVSPDGVALHDGRTFELLNAEALRILGARTQEDVIGRGVLEFFPEEPERASALARLEHARESEGTPTPVREYRLRTLDGVERYAESSTIAIPGSGGRRFMSVVRDTTERRKSEEAVRRSEARLREVMDLVPHFIFVKDRDGRYLMTNRAHAEHFRHTTDSIVGKRAGDIGIVGAQLQALEETDARLRETNEKCYLPEHQVTGPDGKVRTYSTLRIPFRFSDEHPDAILAVSIDISDIRESERRLREILDLVPHPIYAKDREGRYLLSNRAHAAFYGRTPGEVVGNHGRAMPPNDAERNAMAAGDGRVLERLERDYQPDVVRTDAAGRARHLNLTKIPFSFFGGEVDSVLGISIDITDLFEAHAKVRESLVLLEATLESTDNGFLVTNAAGRIVRWNRRMLQLFEMPASALEVLEAGDRNALLALTRDVFADPDAVREASRAAAEDPGYEGLHTALLKDGRYVERYTQPMLRDGLPAGRVWSYRDVTARERERVAAAEREAVLERRVDERTRELSKAVADLTLFTSAISHDLRAPLRAVGGFVDMAIEDGGDTIAPQSRRHLERVVNAVRTMNAMVEGLLALARQTRAPIHRQPVDVVVLAREVFEELSQGATKAVEFRASPCPAANADPVLMRNVMQNLIANALKYSRNRERPVIEVGAAEHEGAPAWFVRDNGAGFDPKYADKLFQPFGRLHSPREFEGTGIGLAAAHRILERHGGRIWADARPGEGATFWFTLP